MLLNQSRKRYTRSIIECEGYTKDPSPPKADQDDVFEQLNHSSLSFPPPMVYNQIILKISQGVI